MYTIMVAVFLGLVAAGDLNRLLMQTIELNGDSKVEEYTNSMSGSYYWQLLESIDTSFGSFDGLRKECPSIVRQFDVNTNSVNIVDNENAAPLDFSVCSLSKERQHQLTETLHEELAKPYATEITYMVDPEPLRKFFPIRVSVEAFQRSVSHNDQVYHSSSVVFNFERKADDASILRFMKGISFTVQRMLKGDIPKATAPPSEAPSMDAPATETPAEEPENPATDTPTSNPPVIDTPSTDTPSTPGTDAPTIEPPLPSNGTESNASSKNGTDSKNDDRSSNADALAPQVTSPAEDPTPKSAGSRTTPSLLVLLCIYAALLFA